MPMAGGGLTRAAPLVSRFLTGPSHLRRAHVRGREPIRTGRQIPEEVPGRGGTRRRPSCIPIIRQRRYRGQEYRLVILLTDPLLRHGGTTRAGTITPASTLRPGPMALCGPILLAGPTRLARVTSQLPVTGPAGATAQARASLWPGDITQIPAMGPSRIAAPARDMLSPMLTTRARVTLSRRSARTTAAAGGCSWCLTELLGLAWQVCVARAGMWPRPLGGRHPDGMARPARKRGSRTAATCGRPARR